MHTYIREEIQIEQLVRNLDPFRLFLQIVAQMNGEMINYTNLAKTPRRCKDCSELLSDFSDTHLAYS